MKGSAPATASAPLAGHAAIGLGANLGASLDDCRATLEAALATLDRSPGVRLLRRSRWYRSAPVGPPQPDFVNGCALLAVELEPEALLDRLLAVEQRFGRVRRERWGPRSLDLDLLLMGERGERQLASPRLQLPHPRLRERAFVLVPLAEIAPHWTVPPDGRCVAELAARRRARLSDADDPEALEALDPARPPAVDVTP